MGKALDKTEKVAKHFITIYTVIGIIAAGAAYASDEYHKQYLTVEKFNAVMVEQKEERAELNIKKEIKQLIREVSELKISLRYARYNRDKNRIRDLITSKEADIKILKEGN